jgi:HdeA/HdeB family
MMASYFASRRWIATKRGSSPAEGEDMRKILMAVTAGVAMLMAGSSAKAAVELSAYADSSGYIDVQKLTCSQLANTFQEDADFLGVWYSGWYNGLAKKHAINVPRVKEQIHNVIVYCKANQDKLVIQAIDVMAKREQQEKK